MDTDRSQLPTLDDVGERIATIERIRAHAAEVRRRFEALHAETEPLEPEGAPTSDEVAPEAVIAGQTGEPQPDDGALARADALQAQLHELEARRRDEVADLQRAQESLANTQVELVRTTKELRAAEARIRQLEATIAAGGLDLDVDGAAPADEAIAPSIVARRDAAPRPSMDAVAARFPSAARFPGAPAPQDAPLDGWDVTPSTDAPPADPADGGDEGLTLRDRLTRAAGARHRHSGT